MFDGACNLGSCILTCNYLGGQPIFLMFNVGVCTYIGILFLIRKFMELLLISDYNEVQNLLINLLFFNKFLTRYNKYSQDNIYYTQPKINHALLVKVLYKILIGDVTIKIINFSNSATKN